VIRRDDRPWAILVARRDLRCRLFAMTLDELADNAGVRAARWNGAVPYDLRDQPVPVENVILHLGFELRNVRLIRLETQTRLSEASGVSQATWSMIENGLAEGVRLELLARIAASLHLELVLRPCSHTPDGGRLPPNGRMRRTQGATRIPGSGRLDPGPDWDERTPW
jgi:transcriptional regulator with XRE-family HTH domain